LTREPTFLDLHEVMEIHRDQIERYGGTIGVRDEGLLESALAMPKAGMGGEYFHTDLFEMAAAYLFHLAKNHPFIDGNKRVAAMSAFVFLAINDVDLTAPEAAYERLVLDVAGGKTQKAAIAEFLRRHTKSR
jgi:death-on-curing protein